METKQRGDGCAMAFVVAGTALMWAVYNFTIPALLWWLVAWWVGAIWFVAQCVIGYVMDARHAARMRKELASQREPDESGGARDE